MSNVDFVSSKKRNRIIGSIVTAVILCGVALFIFGYLMQTDDPRRQKGAVAEVLEISGEIQLVRNFKNIPIEQGLIVMSGDFFRTKADARVKIQYLNDETIVAIDKSSNVIFNAMDKGKRMNLGKGTMTITAPDQPADKPMVIVTHSSEVTVLKGGTFTFAFVGLDATLSVDSGEMQFRRFTDGEVVNVAAGQSHKFKPAGPETIEFESS